MTATKCFRGADDKGVAYSGARDLDQRGMSPGYTRLVAEHRGRFVYWEVLTHTLDEIDPSEGIEGNPVAAWQIFGWPGKDGHWKALGEHHYVRLHGCADPVPVVATEDPDGDHLGWIDTGKDDLKMIQHKRIFDIQFPYGSKVEVERGKGRIVPLRIEAAARSALKGTQS